MKTSRTPWDGQYKMVQFLNYVLKSAEQHHQDGLMLMQQQKYADALSSFTKAVDLEKSNPAFYCNKGTAHRMLNDLVGAEQCYTQALNAYPKHADTLFNIGTLRMKQGRHQESLKAFNKVLNIDPLHSHALAQKASVMLALIESNTLAKDHQYKLLVNAAKICAKSIEINPKYFDGWSIMGRIHFKAREFQKAIKAFSAALTLNNNHPDMWNYLGVCLEHDNRYFYAAHCFDRVRQLRPDWSQGIHNYAGCLLQLGRQWDALAVVDEYLKQDPPDELQAQTHSSALFSRLSIDTDFEHVVSKFKEWAARYADPLMPTDPPKLDWNGKRKIRVGFVSRDFRAHSAQSSFGALLRNFDQTKFEVFAYNDHESKDVFTQSLIPSVTGWRDVYGMTNDDMAQLIKSDAIDVLIDLAGHTTLNRLLVFARKPAPIQMSGLGFGYTTGMQAMDYLFVDPVLLPMEYRHLIPEQCLDLTSILHWQPPAHPVERHSPFAKNGFVTFGNFGSLFKITPDVMAVWAKILNQVPNSQLILKTPLYDEERLCDAVAEEFVSHGLAAERLEFRGKTTHMEHLLAYNDIDIMLDTWPYHSGVTACEALYMGKPVISMGVMGTRGAESVLSQVWNTSAMKRAVMIKEEAEIIYIREAVNSAATANVPQYEDIADIFLDTPICNTDRYVQEVYGLIEGAVSDHRLKGIVDGLAVKYDEALRKLED